MIRCIVSLDDSLVGALGSHQTRIKIQLRTVNRLLHEQLWKKWKWLNEGVYVKIFFFACACVISLSKIVRDIFETRYLTVGLGELLDMHVPSQLSLVYSILCTIMRYIKFKTRFVGDREITHSGV